MNLVGDLGEQAASEVKLFSILRLEREVIWLE